MYLLDHYQVSGVDIHNVSPRVHGYMQGKKTVLRYRALEQLIILEGFQPHGARQRFTRLQSAIDTVQRLRKSRDLVIEISAQSLAWDREDFDLPLKFQKMDQESDHW